MRNKAVSKGFKCTHEDRAQCCFENCPYPACVDESQDDGMVSVHMDDLEQLLDVGKNPDAVVWSRLTAKLLGLRDAQSDD